MHLSTLKHKSSILVNILDGWSSLKGQGMEEVEMLNQSDSICLNDTKECVSIIIPLYRDTHTLNGLNLPCKSHDSWAV